MVGLVLVTSLSSLAMVNQGTRAGEQVDTATRYLQVLAAEALALPFEDPETPSDKLGPESGEGGRPTWDDFDDFENWQSSDLAFLGGDLIEALKGWSASATVAYCYADKPAVDAVVATDLKRIEFNLESPLGKTYSCCVCKSRDGPHQQPRLLTGPHAGQFQIQLGRDKTNSAASRALGGVRVTGVE